MGDDFYKGVIERLEERRKKGKLEEYLSDMLKDKDNSCFSKRFILNENLENLDGSRRNSSSELLIEENDDILGKLEGNRTDDKNESERFSQFAKKDLAF